MTAKYLLFEKDLIRQVQNSDNLCLRENDCDEHFPKSLSIEDVIFSAAENI